MFEQAEVTKLTNVKDEILSQVNELGTGLEKKRNEVIDSRKEMWREARRAVRDFDDIADLYIFAEEVSANERKYEETSKQLLKLKKMMHEPYFARIDFKEDGYDQVEQIYVGRYSLFDEKKQYFHIYDWRAPISSLYYDFGVGDASFDVPAAGTTIAGLITLKRQYQIEKGELIYLFDNDIAIDDEILRRELSKATEAHIKVIVNTIQSEQNKAIRASENNILVYGPAGSGKTSVGLHRLAYLLYRDRNRLNSSKLRIFSPSPVFASYIAGIIPELGEEDIINLDFPSLVKEKAQDKRKFFGFYQQIDHLVTHHDERTEWLFHKYSPEFLDGLEEFVAHYSPSFDDVTFNADILVSASRLEGLYGDRTSTSTLKSKTDRVVAYVEREYSEYLAKNLSQITALFNDIDGENYSDGEIRHKFEEEKSVVMRDLKSRLRPRSGKMLERFLKTYAAGSGLSRNFAKKALEMDRLYYEDALLLFYTDILTGRVAQDKIVKHILIDEAQDLSHLHHRILAKLYTASHFTVLADANQALYKGISIDSTSGLVSLYPAAANIPLNKSYRSTYEINTFAAQYLKNPNPDASYMRHGEEPHVIASSNFFASIKQIVDELPPEYNTIGIILPTAALAHSFHDKLKAVYDNPSHPLALIASEENDFAPGVMVMAVPLAKGLEFDVVIAPEIKGERASLFGEELVNRMMYLICTRAMHRLYLLQEK